VAFILINVIKEKLVRLCWCLFLSGAYWAAYLLTRALRCFESFNKEVLVLFTMIYFNFHGLFPCFSSFYDCFSMLPCLSTFNSWFFHFPYVSLFVLFPLSSFVFIFSFLLVLSTFVSKRFTFRKGKVWKP
jgi:hypothetical protein